jgi:uracil-DNA glycosylase family 4
MSGPETRKRTARPTRTIHTTTSPSNPASSDVELADFWRLAMPCRECPNLSPWQKFPPSARGTTRFRVMILGEAPGRVSLDNRRPFSNPRNLMIRQALARAFAPRRIEPEALLYFSDTVKCWPASPTGANRSPTTRETATCVGRHLLRELAIVQPRIIFAFGLRATGALLGNSTKLSEIHGSVCHTRDGIRVIPLMHPSTINIAGMRRVGIMSLDDYERRLAVLFRREIGPLEPLLDQPDETKES